MSIKSKISRAREQHKASREYATQRQLAQDKLNLQREQRRHGYVMERLKMRTEEEEARQKLMIAKGGKKRGVSAKQVASKAEKVQTFLFGPPPKKRVAKRRVAKTTK